MGRPQVLVFIDWYAPGFRAGGPVRSLVNMVDHLRDRVGFHIVTSDTDYMEIVPYAGVIPDRWTTLPGGERVWYASRRGTSRETWRRLIADRPWDAVYINGMYSRWYSIEPLRLLKGSGLRTIVAVRGMLAAGMMEHGALKKRLFLSAMRAMGLYRGVEFQATNHREVSDVKRWIGDRSIVHLVPNLPRRAIEGTVGPPDKIPGELRLVSIGRIAVEKNTLFAIERLKHLKGRVTYDLHGTIYDEPYWRLCERAIAGLPTGIRVEHKGDVRPDRIPALLGEHHALFMPSQGENFGHAMLEALAAGLPLVVSDRTPWRGLEAAHAGWDLPLEDPERFSRALQQLVDMDEGRYRPWSRGAFELGRRYLTDPANIEKCFALFQRHERTAHR